ncbi:hypothetical protein LJC52_04825 [Bacteroidales bacterium OttesenSCG-928-A17]|nr:hypothetical protein [Bacteroidales bacterium OttesenSCG-928-A17]
MKKISINKKLLLLLISFALFQLGTADEFNLTAISSDINFNNWSSPDISPDYTPSGMDLYENTGDFNSDYFTKTIVHHEDAALYANIPAGTICPRCGGELETSPCDNIRTVNGIPIVCGYVYGSGEGTSAELPEPIGNGLFVLLLAGFLYVCLIVYRRLRKTI